MSRKSKPSRKSAIRSTKAKNSVVRKPAKSAKAAGGRLPVLQEIVEEIQRPVARQDGRPLRGHAGRPSQAVRDEMAPGRSGLRRPLLFACQPPHPHDLEAPCEVKKVSGTFSSRGSPPCGVSYFASSVRSRWAVTISGAGRRRRARRAPWLLDGCPPGADCPVLGRAR